MNHYDFLIRCKTQHLEQFSALAKMSNSLATVPKIFAKNYRYDYSELSI